MTLGDKPNLNLTSEEKFKLEVSEEKFKLEVLRDIDLRIRKRLWEREVSRYKSGFREEYFSMLGTLNAMGLTEKHWSQKEMDSYHILTKSGKEYLKIYRR